MAPVESFGAALCILPAALTPLAVFYTKLTCTLITSNTFWVIFVTILNTKNVHKYSRQGHFSQSKSQKGKIYFESDKIIISLHSNHTSEIGYFWLNYQGDKGFFFFNTKNSTTLAV